MINKFKNIRKRVPSLVHRPTLLIFTQSSTPWTIIHKFILFLKISTNLGQIKLQFNGNQLFGKLKSFPKTMWYCVYGMYKDTLYGEPPNHFHLINEHISQSYSLSYFHFEFPSSDMCYFIVCLCIKSQVLRTEPESCACFQMLYH